MRGSKGKLRSTGTEQYCSCVSPAPRLCAATTFDRHEFAPLDFLATLDGSGFLIKRTKSDIDMVDPGTRIDVKYEMRILRISDRQIRDHIRGDLLNDELQCRAVRSFSKASFTPYSNP
jgi:hypothetical protein